MTARIAPALAALMMLSLWLGAAILVAAVVAPAAFAVLPTRTLAGALVGRVLLALFWAGMLVGVAGVAIARATGVGMIAMAGSLITFLACAIAQLVISPRIERIRAAIDGPVDGLPLTDPRRMEFGRLHGMSVLTMGIAAVGAVVALIVLTRFIATRSTP